MTWGTSTAPRRWGGRRCYCGTPLKYSFSEAGQHKSVTLVELGPKGEVTLSTLPLTPLHDLRELRGRYAELTDRRYAGTAVDDYLHITLTDEQDVPEALAKLRVIYPNLLRLDYDNARTRTQQAVDSPAEPRATRRWSILRRFTNCRTTSP